MDDDLVHDDLVHDDFATRRRRHRRRSVGLLVAGALAGPVLVAGAVAASGGDEAGVGPRIVAIEEPGTPTGPVTPQFPPVSPTPRTPAQTPAQSPAPTRTPSATVAPSARPTAAAPEDGAASASPSPTTSTPPGPTASPTPARPTSTPTPADLPHAEPTRIEVPDVGIASDLVRLDLNPDGSLQVPADYDLAGWYARGPAPGDVEAPPAVIVGHVDSTTGPAVFYRLRELVEGQAINVTREDGSVAVFRVRDTTQYPKSGLPADEVYATRPPSELVLITCSGAFDEAARSYLDNFVVTARLDREASTIPS